MSRVELEELRKKRGECVTCGRKCFRKKLFKFVPIDDHGRVLNGRCLNCHPLDPKSDETSVLPAVSRPATREDLERFSRSQLNLATNNRNFHAAAAARRPKPSRAMSSAPRSDNRSIGSSSASSRPNMGVRARSMLPTSSAATSALISERSQPTIPEAAASSRGPSGLLASSQGESQALSLPPHPSRGGGGAPSPSSAIHSYSNGQNNSDGYASEGYIGTGGPPAAAASASTRSVPARLAPSSDRSLDTASSANTGRASKGLDVKPTHEELERAALTILAAQKHGVYDDMQDLHVHLEHLNTGERPLDGTGGGYEVRAESARSIRSASTLGEHPDEIDGFEVPSHGILNRGGAYPLTPGNRPNVSHIVGGSSRTLSSMSSIEEDLHPMNGHLGGVNIRGRVDAVYEEELDGADHSVLSQSSSRKSGLSRDRSIDDPLTEEQYIDRIANSGGSFGEILVTLREAMDSPIVVREALETLARLQFTPDDHDMLADMGAPMLIADAMQAHAAILNVQLWGCGAVWNMSGTIRNQLAFVDAGSLDLILAAMDRFIEHVDVQEKAIATLSNLGATSENLAVLIDKGAIGRIIEGMNKHSEVASVQIKGCSAVTNLASHDSPLKTQVMALGAGGAVVISMVMHPEDFYLQEKALRALRNLCANSEENKVELANIGGIDAVISAMQVHRDEAGVQEEGAWTLSNLAGNDDNKAVIGDCGGIDVVIRAMWVHSDNVGVQEWCARALFTLSLDPHNGDVILEVGGISAIVNAMQAHVDSPAVQEMGCAVLGNLSGSDESKMRIVDEEALDAIVLAMVLFTDDMQVQERACLVLLRLAISENFKAMQAANIPELARVAAEKFPDACEEPGTRLIHALSGY